MLLLRVRLAAVMMREPRRGGNDAVQRVKKHLPHLRHTQRHRSDLFRTSAARAAHLHARRAGADEQNRARVDPLCGEQPRP